jgi:hypothetical protein
MTPTKHASMKYVATKAQLAVMHPLKRGSASRTDLNFKVRMKASFTRSYIAAIW